MVELMTLLMMDRMERSLHTLPQLKHFFGWCWILILFPFTSAHTCCVGFGSSDWGGQVSTSKSLHWQPLLDWFCSIFKIVIMLKYDTRRFEMVPINCLHEPILKNAKIHSLCHLPLYLAHVMPATGSHTTPHKNYTTSMCNCLTHMMSMLLRFSIPHPTILL